MTTLSVLIVAATLLGQKLETGVKESYDKLEDRTNLMAAMGNIRDDNDGNIALIILRNYAGKGRTKPSGRFRCIFLSSAVNRWRFDRNSDVILLADDATRYRFEAEREPIDGDEARVEIMTIDLSPEQLDVLAKAKTVEGKIGLERFELNGEQREILKEFGGYAADPSKPVPVKPAPKPKSGPQVTVPVASQIPAGQAVAFDDGKKPIMLIVENPELDTIFVPTNTPLLVLGKAVRNVSGQDITVLRAEVLEGEYKGVVGEVLRSRVVLSTARKQKSTGGKVPGGLKPESDADKAKKSEAQAAAKLKLGTNLIKLNPKGAAGYFREAIRLAPGTQVAKEAQYHLDGLEMKSDKAKEGDAK